MNIWREALYLPMLFLTVVLLGGVRILDRVALLPPSLFSLVLAVLLLGVLIKCGALAPERLMNGARGALANLNGLVALVTLFVGSAQAFCLMTPDAGLPHVLFNVFFLVLLFNTLAAAPDRIRLLRSLAVTFGAAFILKFIILAAISDPEGGRLRRVLLVLLEGITLGALTQPVSHPASGYLAFLTLVLFLVGLAWLPPRTSSRSAALSAGFGERHEITMGEDRVGTALQRCVVTLLVRIAGLVGGREVTDVAHHGF
jgi:hypothetical protein